MEGAQRIEALLRALLAYWEVTEREQDSFVSIDCGAVLAKVLLNLEAAIAESGAIITSDPLPTVVAEEVMLMQIFQNLISNSIKYQGKETPRIHVSAERDAEGWLFSVRDNGIGIDPRIWSACSACSNACMEAKFPAPASAWRFVRRS